MYVYSQTIKKILILFSVAVISLLFIVQSVWADSTNVSVTIAITECSDGIDNDIDGFVDYPNDSDCESASDDNEEEEEEEPEEPPTPPEEPTVDSGRTTLSSGSGSTSTTEPKKPITGISFSGLAYPSAAVRVLRNGLFFVSAQTNQSGEFNIKDVEVAAGVHTFSLKAVDADGRESLPVTFSVNISQGRIVLAGEIVIPPTISVSPERLTPGEGAVVSGVSVPGQEVEVLIGGEVFRVNSNSNGVYELFVGEDIVSKTPLVKSRVVLPNLSSGYSAAILLSTSRFSLAQDIRIGDINGDDRVELVDFSILAYWYRKTNPPKTADLNSDNVVDLRDLSILAFHWTG